MLKLYIHNKTTSTYDAIRRATKAAFKDSLAYRTRQVMFDDTAKEQGVMGLYIGDSKAVDLELDVDLNSVSEITRVARQFAAPASKSSPDEQGKDFRTEEYDPIGDNG